MAQKDIFTSLDDLASELNVSDEWLQSLWAYYATFDWQFRRMVASPITFETMAPDEVQEEFDAYARHFNSSSIDDRIKLYKRFCDYCHWVTKQRGGRP